MVLIMSVLHLHHHVNVHVQFQFGNRNDRNRNAACCLCLINKNQCRVSVSGKSVPARDRVIDFGKYKGKMLGSVPSSYLKWVSNNLRAGHFEEWANLADQVLTDPIYRDRIEWEFAHNVLTGNANSSSSLSSTSSSLLEEISERFGWDNLDKVGWSQVDFDLLGTSKAARIPRLVNFKDTQPKPKHCPPSLSCSSTQWERRMERRERQKMTLRRRRRRTETEEEDTNIIDGHNHNHNHNANAIANPFPGRQAFLRRAAQLQSRNNNNICF